MNIYPTYLLGELFLSGESCIDNACLKFPTHWVTAILTSLSKSYEFLLLGWLNEEIGEVPTCRTGVSQGRCFSPLVGCQSLCVVCGGRSCVSYVCGGLVAKETGEWLCCAVILWESPHLFFHSFCQMYT